MTTASMVPIVADSGLASEFEVLCPRFLYSMAEQSGRLDQFEAEVLSHAHSLRADRETIGTATMEFEFDLDPLADDKMIRLELQYDPADEAFEVFVVPPADEEEDEEAE